MDKNPGNVDSRPAGDEFILSGRVTVRKFVWKSGSHEICVIWRISSSNMTKDTAPVDGTHRGEGTWRFEVS